jgi:hypothetical protein
MRLRRYIGASGFPDDFAVGRFDIQPDAVAILA